MKIIREIKNKQGTVFFRRYHLFSTPWFHCWMHHIYRADEDKHLHDHPWNYLSIVLSGCYVEELTNGRKRFRWPFSVSLARHTHIHKIYHILNQKRVTTLFFVGKKTYDWGYHVDGKVIPNIEYREMKRRGEV